MTDRIQQALEKARQYDEVLGEPTIFEVPENVHKAALAVIEATCKLRDFYDSGTTSVRLELGLIKEERMALKLWVDAVLGPEERP